MSRAEWTPVRREPSSPLVIGWIGSHSTAPYLAIVAPVLRELAAEGRRFELRVVGAETRIPGVTVSNIPFDLSREVEHVRGFDIGIAPMPAGPWTDGKCGFKQLQYMAAGVPCLTSGWAGARDFVVAEENALVCRDQAEWKAALVRVLDDAALRSRLALAGRAVVEREYCAEVQVDRIARVLRGTVA